MNSLLKRQIRKYLSDELASNKDLEKFLEAIDKSYTNFDEQFVMQQRAMTISSEELFEANKQLREEADAQQKVIDKLQRVIETLKFYDLPEHETIENLELDGLKLVEFIDNQTKEIVEMNKQREKMLGELAYQNQELSDYAHMVSHDLKTPLRGIESLTTWLNLDYEDVLDANGKENLRLIKSNVKKMDLLIKGILEYSTINKNEIEFYKVNLNNVIGDVLEEISVPDHIKIQVKDSLPVVSGEKYRLHQIFNNLLTNAINYNDKSKGIINVGVRDKNDLWEFYVEDNGKGIKEDYHKKIFKTFNKLENNTESSGIGLSIVKKIVNLYEGDIWVESKLGVGSTFYFTLKKNINGTA